MIGPDSPNPVTIERQPLFPYVGCSVLFHVGVIVAAWVGGALMTWLFEPAPRPKPEVIEVFAALPKSRLNVPERASVAPRLSGEVKPTEAPKELPPVKESDLVIHKEVPKNEGNTDDDRKRQEVLDAIERNRLIEQLMNAPEGKNDRMQTDPNGVEGLETAVIGAAAKGDPEYAKWVARVQRQMMSHFHPLAQGRTDIKCRVTLQVDPTSGAILGSEVTTPSGVLAFDQAAISAVNADPTIPLPPEKYLPLLADGVTIEFVPPPS